MDNLGGHVALLLPGRHSIVTFVPYIDVIVKFYKGKLTFLPINDTWSLLNGHDQRVMLPLSD